MWSFLELKNWTRSTWVLLPVLTFSVLESIVMFSEDGHTAPEYYYLLSLYWRTLWCFLKMDIQRQHFSPYSLSSRMYWLPRFSTHLPFPEMVELTMMRGWEYPRWKYSPCQATGKRQPLPEMSRKSHLIRFRGPFLKINVAKPAPRLCLLANNIILFTFKENIILINQY